MNRCPRCGQSTLVERSDILPPPPGTGWAPQPRRWSECTNCGYDSRPGHGRTGSSTASSGRTTGGTFLGVIFVALGLFGVIMFAVMGARTGDLTAFIYPAMIGVLLIGILMRNKK